MDSKKKILMVCQHFWPEEFRINDICASLVEMGYDVDVICGIPNYPHGKFFEGYSFSKKRHEMYKGVNIYRASIVPRGTGNPVQVFLNYISFPIGALSKVLKLAKNDYDKIIVFQITPIFMAYPAMLMKKLIKKDIYMYVQDLWPESLYSVYNFNSKLYKRIFDKISDDIYKSCDYFMTTSKGIKQKIQMQYGIPEERLLYLPNWAEKLYEEKKENKELKYKYKDSFNIMFAGNIGPAQSFNTIIEAAKLCYDKGYKDIKWIIVGDGMSRKSAEEKVAMLGIDRTVDFLGRKPVSSMPEYYDVADALLVSLVKSDLFAMTIPSKIQSYLAAGKPIIASLDGEGASIIQDSGAGLACESENPEKLSNIAINMYLSSDGEKKRMGENARKYYVENFDKDMLLKRLINFMFNTSSHTNE